jgi:hypothetical protein
MVCAPEGMFRKSIGGQYLFVNMAIIDDTIIAEEWLKSIQLANPGRFTCLAYGSAQTNKWKEI